MTDLLIRKIDPDLKRMLEQRAKKSGKSLSDEVKGLLNHVLAERVAERPIGTALVEHFRDLGPIELDIPRRDELSTPPDLE